MFSILLLSAAAGLLHGQTAIKNVWIVDGTGAPAFKGTVLFESGRISAVGAMALPQATQVIDGKGYTVIPGLFDLHTHLATANAPGIQGDYAKHLAAYLLCGITTVADLGTYGEAFAPKRNLQESGQVAGPHVRMAYRITTPGGHGAEGGRSDIFSLEVLTPREAKDAIGDTLPYHPDLIKIFTDGWRYGRAAEMTSMDLATLQAAVEAAHAASLPVITHTVTLARAKDAARAKVDILGHAIQDLPVDDELIRLFRESGITYVPTMAIYEPRGTDLLTPVLQRVLEPLAIEHLPAFTPATGNSRTTPRWQILRGNVRRLYEAGIPIACGTDAGGSTGTTFHGWATLRELELLVGAGLSPLEAIAAATSVSAKALRVDAERGTIAPGKSADLVLVKGMPHQNIGDLQQVERVWVAGKETDRTALAGLIQSRPKAPLASMKATALLDDFEAPGDRSRIGTRWENATDAGQDHSKILFSRIARSPNNHALMMLGKMSDKDQPRVTLRLPLQPGGVVPVDASAFQGVQFDVRGEGEYFLQTPRYSEQSLRPARKAFQASPDWKSVKMPLEQARDLLSLEFVSERKAGAKVWLELDNLRFY